jgi:hypothetical protein
LIARLGCARTCLFASLALAGLVAACGEAPAVVSPSPSAAALTPPPPRPSPPPGPVLTGVVFQTTEQGRRPVPGAHVFVTDFIDGPYGDYGWSEVLADTNGRFTAAKVYLGRPVKITAYSGPLSGLWNQSGLYQTCAVHPMIEGDTTADIDLVQAGVLTYDSPTLSGVVIETSHGRRPVAGTPVLYSSNGHDGADVYTRTDANGRYSFCRLPLGPGYVLAGCAGAVMPYPAFRGTNVPVEIRGDTVLAVDITALVSSCP